MPAAARVGDMHVCPLVDGAKPHVGGPIVTGGGTVLIDGQEVATVGYTCNCVGPPDSIASGSSTVYVGGQPVARVGDKTAHGGVITTGSPTVDIGG
jgi:uncharacterized Zn-binding protein involved in type VI secretion